MATILNQLVSIINQSEGDVTDAQCEQMAHCLGVQLSRDLAPEVGWVPAIEFVPTEAMAKGSPCYLQKTLDVPDALGYHYEENGIWKMRIGTGVVLAQGGEVLRSPNSILTTMSHEFCELVGDGPANKWSDGPDGTDWAWELCDYCEDMGYDIDGGTVSNFVIPRTFFDPEAPLGTKLDYMGALQIPFSRTPGGYGINRTEQGNVTQVFGKMKGTVHVGGGIVIVTGPKFDQKRIKFKMSKARSRIRKYRLRIQGVSP